MLDWSLNLPVTSVLVTSHSKLRGLIIYPIVLTFKYSLNFLKGRFIPWGQCPGQNTFLGTFFPQ